MDRKKVLEVFSHDWGEFYFTLGRAKPTREVQRLWYTHQGQVIGSFQINRIVINDGTLPKLRSITGEVSEWQIKPDSWVAICKPPFTRLRRSRTERVYHDGFRGWRYFDFDQYAQTPESRYRV